MVSDSVLCLCLCHYLARPLNGTMWVVGQHVELLGHMELSGQPKGVGCCQLPFFIAPLFSFDAAHRILHPVLHPVLHPLARPCS